MLAQCNGKKALLLHRRGLLSFAIGVAGGTVIGGQGWVLMVHGKSATDLPVSKDAWTDDIYRSCGSALAPLGEMRRTTQDVAGGRVFRLTPLAGPVCSADRSLIVGTNARGELVVSDTRPSVSGSPGEAGRGPAPDDGKILGAAGEFGPSYAISPSGQWIAYFRGPPTSIPQLCLVDTHNWSTRCHSKTAAGLWPLDAGAAEHLSLNDVGQVLLVAPDEGGCWYNEWRVSRTKFPGSAGDECFSIAVASASSPPRIIIPLGSRPAWVDRKLLEEQFGVFRR
ncbi:MAG: hypothetical protein ACRD1M_13090 [Terriglobales bacterium]